MNRIRLAGWLLSLIALVAVVFASVAYGSTPIPLGTVVDAVTGFDPTIDTHLVVRTLRIPRTALGLVVGLALGLAGTVLQGLTRNPLADPGIFGVNAGAALAVVFASYVLGISTVLGYIWFAFAGAAAAAVLVYTLGSLGRDGAAPVKLAISGAALTSMLASVTTCVLLIDRVTLEQYRFWMVGSLAGRGGTVALTVIPFVVIGAVLALISGPALNALALGDDMARSLGQRVGLVRVRCAIIVVLLSGAATAAAGPIAFVGLTVPHIARVFGGADHRWMLAYSAVLAPILLLGADVLGRVLARPTELQAGIVTALVGAPVFVLLVRRRRLAHQ